MAALEWPVLTWNVPLGKVPDGVPESASLTIIELRHGFASASRFTSGTISEIIITVMRVV